MIRASALAAPLSARRDPGQFGDIVIKDQTAQGGKLVRVKDVARVNVKDAYRHHARILWTGDIQHANAITIAHECVAKLNRESFWVSQKIAGQLAHEARLFGWR
jgi:hypothetical protein